MGIFDIFKKKKTDATFPENELEQCLLRAASETSAQKEFYIKLLWSQLFVLTVEQYPSEEGSKTLEEDTTVQFITFEEGQIPIFTSANRIFDKGIIKNKVSYVSLKGQDLFGLAKGATFVLNPYSDYGKELTPEEIESLLDGTIYDKIDLYEKEAEKFQEFNKIFERAGKKQKGLISLGRSQSRKLNESEKKRLEDSIADFKKCLDIVPDHWQSMVLMAKSLQRLGKHSEALELLETALQIELENPSIAMEASLEAMHLEEIDKAIHYSEESLKRKPDDFVLLGNYAMNLLIAERDIEAQKTIEKAIKIQPKDQVNRNIERIIKGVIAGKRDRPTFEDAIK